MILLPLPELLLIAGACAAAPVTLYFWKRSPPKTTRVSPDPRGSDRRSFELERNGGGVSMFDKLNRIFGPGAGPTEAPPPVPAPAAPVAFDFEDERIPSAARVNIRRILACIEEVGKAMEREQVPGFSRIDMEQMRDIHLPKLARSYIDIPAGYRSEIFRKTGKSASFILLESLDKMQAKMDEILKNLAQSDLDAFTENAQFIGQRYADEDNPFR